MENLIKFISKHVISLSIGLISLILIITISALCIQTNINADKVFDNISVDNIDLSNQTKEDLRQTLENYYNKKLTSFNIEFVYGNIKESISSKDLGLYYPIDEITEKIFNYGKDNNIIKSTFNRIKILLEPVIFSFKPQHDKTAVNVYIDHLAGLINKDVIEPKISFEGNKLIGSNSSIGYEVDKETLNESINDILDSYDGQPFTKTLDIPVNEVNPTVSSDILNKMEILGTYSTPLKNSSTGRTHNIKLFMNALNGKVLLPDEIYSCDKTAGSREAKDGYTSAPGYIGNKVVDILAGGICQGVTTLYNAVIYADLKITERAPHNLPVTYAPLGRDATIAGGSIDFKFKNNKKNPIVVQCYVSNNHVYATIWGINENLNREIKISTKEYGPKSSETFKHTYENGILIKTERLSKDRYN
ncbi:VanW family protein [Clostridium tarantellae]|nr:VanW family protein [Clostridium tarantellae]